jgi:hypothetical protein
MAGYSGTPLVTKLGLKPGHQIFVFEAPEAYFEWIAPLPAGLVVKEKLAKEMDVIHVFVKESKVFQAIFRKAKKFVKKDGMIWVSWPKKSAKVETDLDENIIRDFGLAEGLVDVKVCAVSEVWSGLKFVIRVKDR